MFICADIIEIENIENFFKENEGAKGDDIVHVSLPYGRILEIGHEKNMVPRDKWFFSWQIHCNEEEFDSGLFSETIGIIDVACTNTFSEEIYRNMILWAMRFGKTIRQDMPEKYSPADLKNGMILESKDGTRWAVISNTLVELGAWNYISGLNPDLTSEDGNKCHDIVSVYEGIEGAYIEEIANNPGRLIWRHPE